MSSQEDNNFEEMAWNDEEFTNKKPMLDVSNQEEAFADTDPPPNTEPAILNSSLQELNEIPLDWKGVSKIDKVLTLVNVVQKQIQRVRSGNFDFSRSYRVAALALEGLMELSDFFADVESRAKSAKNLIEYSESEVASNILSKSGGEKKVSEVALKRMSLSHPEVKQAKDQYIDMEREFKKWKCIYEILQEAHVFFRGLSKR